MSQPRDYPLNAHNKHRSAQVIQIDSSKHLAVVVICSVICGFAIAASIFASYTSYKAEREARMLQYYVNEVDGKLIHAGFIEPRDRWSPEKRKQYEGENQ